MKKGILGRKIGMTQVFTDEGKLIPVTVIEIEPNVVTQIKTHQTDGYDAVQLGFGTKREKLSNKPEVGHVAKANTTPKRFLREIRGVDINNYKLGQELKADIFEAGDIVDVTGTSKGKGTQGVIKRFNQSRGPMSHGSQYHRGVGSMGAMGPMRVFKGKGLAGRMGHETVTIQNLEIVTVDIKNDIILIKGNVPGPKKGLIIIRTSVKKPEVKKEVMKLRKYTIDEAVVEEETEPIEEAVVEEEPVAEEVVESTDETDDEPIEESSQESDEQ